MIIILLDNRFFTEEHVKQFGKMILKGDRLLALCDFPIADCSMIKAITINEESNK